jgi:glycosyltransferase 2 family protein
MRVENSRRHNIARASSSPYFKKGMVLFRILLGAGLVAFSLWRIDVNSLTSLLAQVDFFWLSLALASILASLGLKIIRWGWLLSQFGVQVGKSRVISAFLIGQAANMILPFRAGEVVRTGWVCADAPKNTVGTVAAILIEKYIDLSALSILVLLYGGNAIFSNSQWQVPFLIAFTALLAVFAWAGPLFWSWLSPLLKQKISQRLVIWIDRADLLMNRVQQLRKPRFAAVTAGITAVTWVVMALTNLLVFKALNMPADLYAAVLVLILIYIGVAPTLMPGNFVPFYFFVVYGLAVLAIDEQQRLAYAVLLHAIVTFPPLLFAAGYLIANPAKQGLRSGALK